MMTKRILAIEDDKDIREIIEYLLLSEGYTVKTSNTGDGILSKIEEYGPDLILLDIMLGEHDGRDICRDIKANHSTSKIPVIILSAHPDVVRTVSEAGANDFMHKPFNIDKLMDKIELQLSDLKNRAPGKKLLN